MKYRELKLIEEIIIKKIITYCIEGVNNITLELNVEKPQVDMVVNECAMAS